MENLVLLTDEEVSVIFEVYAEYTSDCFILLDRTAKENVLQVLKLILDAISQNVYYYQEIIIDRTNDLELSKENFNYYSQAIGDYNLIYTLIDIVVNT